MPSSHSSIQKKHVLLAVAIAMNCRTFQFFPGMQLVQELWFGACLLFLMIIYPFWKAKERWRFSPCESYLLLLIVILPALSAFCAWRVYGQPLVYGLAAQRGVALFAFIIAIGYAFRHRTIMVGDVEKSLVFLSWATLIIYTGMQLLLRPSDFSTYGLGFVSAPDEGAEFKFQPFFTLFGFFYYLFRGFRSGTGKYYAFASVFFASSVGGLGGRSLIISAALSVLVLLYRWGGKDFLLRTLPKMVLFAVSVVAVMYVLDSKALSNRYQKFSDAFQVAFTGADVEDPSAASRGVQALAALPHIAEHPLFGNGPLSNQWQRDQDNALDSFYPSAYFFPTDIGVIGVLYVYGVFGILLLGWQYRFALVAVAGIPRSHHTPLLDATKGLLLFSVFNSITTGIFAFYPEVTLFFIMLLAGICLEFQGSRPALEVAPCKA